MKILLKTLILLFFSSFLVLGVQAQSTDPFQWFFDGETRQIKSGESIPLEITFSIPPKHILYKNKMELILVQDQGDEFELSPLEMPAALHQKDPITGADEDVFVGDITLRATLKPKRILPDGEKLLKLQLSYQGCSEKLCFRLIREELLLPIQMGTSISAPQEGSFFSLSNASFKNKSLIVLLIITFLAGLASDLTPCVLPIIPITLAFIGIKKSETHHWKNFLHTFILVLSMAASYAFLGLLAAFLGKSFGFLFQSIYFLIFSVLLYLAFALSMFGLYEMQLPLSLRNTMAKMGGEGILGAIFSGITIGFLAAPCVGPLIATLLLYVAQERNLARGFLLLFAYGLGMGSLFLVVGTFYHRLAPKIHGGVFTNWIKKTFGVLLLLPVFYYGSIVVQHFYKPPSNLSTEDFWMTHDEEGFQKAVTENKPIFMDFFATWCVPCLEMEKTTFSQPEIQNFLKENFIPIKINCTEETPQCKRLVDKYGIIGWPTMLVLNPQGEVIEKIVGETLPPEMFKERLSRVIFP